jgi:hypothetical protein
MEGMTRDREQWSPGLAAAWTFRLWCSRDEPVAIELVLCNSDLHPAPWRIVQTPAIVFFVREAFNSVATAM